MMQRRWRDNCNTMESYYGFGTMMNERGPKEWFGHTGSLQGFVSRTARFPASRLTVTVPTHAWDGLAYPWVDGIMSILSAFRSHGAPSRRLQGRNGRWWSVWGSSGLVAMGQVLCHVSPAMLTPFERRDHGDRGRRQGHRDPPKTLAYNSPGQLVRRVFDRKGRPTELWIGGTQPLQKDAIVAEATARHRKARPSRKPAGT